MNKNIGTPFESWLEEEGIRRQVTAGAIRRVLARQVAAAMAQDGLTKTEMARRMQTSRIAPADGEPSAKEGARATARSVFAKKKRLRE